MKTLAIRTRVIDTWWPWRFGRVVARSATRLTVRWSDGEIWRYDSAHARFLTRA